ncbi:cysteine hydrolase [Staphylococcus taiwanensis]|nr:cysteine hydrolase [Staphylococcus taiwanensis]
MNKKALLVMDMQNGIVNSLAETHGLIQATNDAITVARSKRIPVIFVRVAFSKNYGEISSNNKRFNQIKNSGRPMSVDDKETQIIDDLNVESNDHFIIKKRVSAFTGSDLEVLLRGLQVDHLMLTGVATSGVVLSTAVEASDKDYKLTFLKDAMMDRDEQVHHFLTRDIFPKYGDVLSTSEWDDMSD